MRPSTVHILSIVPLAVASAIQTPSYCSALTAVVGLLSKDACATSFCSSYLKISTSTMITTSTATTIDTTYTTQAIPTSTLTVTADPETAAFTVTSTCTTPGLTKRALATCTTPSYLKYSPAAAISSVCSCFNIPTPKTTLQSVTVTTSTTIVVVIPTTTATTSTTITPTLIPTQYVLTSPPATETVYNDVQTAYNGQLYNVYPGLNSPGPYPLQGYSLKHLESTEPISLQACIFNCESLHRHANPHFNIPECLAVNLGGPDDQGIYSCKFITDLTAACSLFRDESGTYAVRASEMVPLVYN